MTRNSNEDCGPHCKGKDHCYCRECHGKPYWER